MMKETSVGRVIVNEIVPAEVGYLNTIISKKSLRDIISDVIKAVGVARACEFLDGIKNLGYYMAFKGGLSFNLGDIIIPKEKEELVKRGNEEVEQIMMNIQELEKRIKLPEAAGKAVDQIKITEASTPRKRRFIQTAGCQSPERENCQG